MANYHLQFDDEDVKSGLLNVDPDGCLKPAKVIFFKEVLDDGTVLCCGKPAKEMTQEEAYELCEDLYQANALYIGPEIRVAVMLNHSSGIGAAGHHLDFISGGFNFSDGKAAYMFCQFSRDNFKTEDP